MRLASDRNEIDRESLEVCLSPKPRSESVDRLRGVEATAEEAPVHDVLHFRSHRPKRRNHRERRYGNDGGRFVRQRQNGLEG